MSDVVDRYTRLCDQFGARVEAAPDDAWNNPSPCPDWTARDVVNHIVGGQRSIVGAVTGTEPAPPAPDADPKQTWRESFAAVQEALQREGALEAKAATPMGEMPLEFMVGRIYASDVLIHTWDLARAVGGDERLDADAVAQAFKGMQTMDAMLRQGNMFGPKVEPPAGADEQTQFLCFVGRQP